MIGIERPFSFLLTAIREVDVEFGEGLQFLDPRVLNGSEEVQTSNAAVLVRVRRVPDEIT